MRQVRETEEVREGWAVYEFFHALWDVLLELLLRP